MKFTDLNLSRQLLNALGDLQITEPTAIQAKTFAPVMSGKDIVGISQTGTGKTFAYLLPTLRLWKFSKSANPQILIVVPTRELVAQVVEAAEQLTTYLNVEIVGVYGGANIRVQRVKVSEGSDLIVGTPGRLMDLMKDGVLKTNQLKRVIIDEVDEMLNLGFRTQLRTIVDLLPKKRQHLMFSATMTDEVELVIQEFTSYYEKIEAAPSGAPLDNIEQTANQISNFINKANLLELLLKREESMNKVLIFAKTKKLANALFERLAPEFEETLGIIHSSKSQNNRFDTVNKFQDGTYRYLIATDIIARGLDVSGVSHVVNFDLTDTPEKYIHRIGRTGRSEQKGSAISFISEEDQPYQVQIEALMDLSIDMLALPEELVLSEELIPLEMPNDEAHFDVHKTKRIVPSGPAFHEKSAKNSKTKKKRVPHAELMKKLYKNPIKKKGGKKKKRKK